MMTDRDAAEGAMARSAEPIVVSAVEREELDRLVRGHSTPQQLALHARIILLAAEGIGNRESARRLGVTVQTVRCWQRRWDDEPDLTLADRLADAPRPGTRPTFTGCPGSAAQKPASCFSASARYAGCSRPTQLTSPQSMVSAGRLLKPFALRSTHP